MNPKRMLLAVLSLLGSAPCAEIPWPKAFAAPYVDATAWPPFDMAAAARSTGLRRFVLGFVVAKDAKSSKPTWGTYYPADDGSFLKGGVDSLRALGGDVMVSFGGASNFELAVATTSVDSLAKAYDGVVQAYDLHQIDFDIEGAWIEDRASVERRSLALSALQGKWDKEGRKMSIWFTLPTLPAGLGDAGVALVESAVSHGVRIAGVNVMAMDYGTWAAPHPADSMGRYAIQSCTALHDQLTAIYRRQGVSRTDAEIWAMVGATPMIGQNDVQGEVFTIDNARELEVFAKSQAMGRISWWSANRDVACKGGGGVSGNCSSVAQEPFAFANAFLPLEATPATIVPRGSIQSIPRGIPALGWRVRGRDPSGRL